MTSTILAFLERPSPARNLLLVLSVGILLGRIGPFDTAQDFASLPRYAYWIGLTGFNWLIVAVILAAFAQAGALTRLHPVPRAGLAALLAAVPTTFAVAWAETFIREIRTPPPLMMLRLYGDVATLTVALALPTEMVRGHLLFTARATPPTAPPDIPQPRPAAEPAAPPAPPPPEAPAPDRPAFFDRLPPELGTELVAITAEDHYLRVHTAKGNALILCRLADAMAELPAGAGVQVHRSHWVARGAVERAERDGARLVLALKGGLRVPVSRTFLLAVREAGWIQGP